MRYQTSSISKKAKPTIAAEIKTRRAEGGLAEAEAEAGSGSGSGLGWEVEAAAAEAADSVAGMRRASARAQTATIAFRPQASQSMRCEPITSSSTNVDATQPATAPSVLAPYSTASRRRPTSPSVSTACAAAGSVPPIRNVGTHNTIAASTSRTTVPPT